MQRYDFYYLQKVTEAELDAAYEACEQDEFRTYTDTGLIGVYIGASVDEAASPNLTVDVSAGVVRDQTGQRIRWSSIQNVDVSVDENSVSTAVATPGNSKYLSVFVKFIRVNSDPRVDGEQTTVYFNRAESFEFHVVQGAEGATPSPPSLRSDQILLADILIDFGKTQVFNADIDMVTRREWAITASSSSLTIARGQIEDAFQDVADAIATSDGALATHIAAAANQHLASAVDYAGGGAWHDGTTNPAATVEAQLDKIITDLVNNAGADRIGAAAQSSNSQSVTAGSIKDQIGELLAQIDAAYIAPRLLRAQNFTKVVDLVTAGYNPRAAAKAQTNNRIVVVAEDPGVGAEAFYTDVELTTLTASSLGGSPTYCKDVVCESSVAGFVAVGADAAGADIQQNANGQGSWTQRTATGMTTAGDILRAIVWDAGNSYYIAVGMGTSNRAVRSSDGVTWSSPSVQPSVASNGFFGIATDGSGTVVAVGDNGSNGIIHRTTDGGDNWTAVTPGSPPTVFKAVTYDASTGYFYACGDDGSDGVVWRSTDNGVTWTDVSPSTTNLQSTTFTGIASDGEGTILVVGDSSPSLYITTDAGSNWIEFSVGDAATLDFSEANTLYFVAQQFFLGESNDTRDYWFSLRFGIVKDQT